MGGAGAEVLVRDDGKLVPQRQLLQEVCGPNDETEPNYLRAPEYASGRTRGVTIDRAVPNIRSDRTAETRDFFVDLFGFEVAMDLGWVVTLASPTNPSAQVTIIGNDDPAAPGISVGVDDVDAVHVAAVDRGL